MLVRLFFIFAMYFLSNNLSAAQLSQRDPSAESFLESPQSSIELLSGGLADLNKSMDELRKRLVQLQVQLGLLAEKLNKLNHQSSTLDSRVPALVGIISFLWGKYWWAYSKYIFATRTFDYVYKLLMFDYVYWMYQIGSEVEGDESYFISRAFQSIALSTSINSFICFYVWAKTTCQYLKLMKRMGAQVREEDRSLINKTFQKTVAYVDKGLQIYSAYQFMNFVFGWASSAVGWTNTAFWWTMGFFTSPDSDSSNQFSDMPDFAAGTNSSIPNSGNASK